MNIDLQDEYRRLGAFYDAVEPLTGWPDDTLHHVNDAVSAWSPARHLYHILRANGMMLKGIHLICRGDERTAHDGEPNEAGRYVLTQGFIRGRGKAPDAVMPPEDVTREDLHASLARSRRTYDATETFLPQIPTATGRIPHAFLGVLDASEWLRLTRLHAEHHLAIIRDVVGREEAA